MLISSILLLLLAAIGDGAAIRRQDGPSPEVRKALEDAGVDVSKTVAKPNNKVEQVLSIGDSYSAGIGANGQPDEWGLNNCSRYDGAWPVLLSRKDEWKDLGKDGKQPWLTFGACSGNVMVDVREKMLEQGDALDAHKIGPDGSPYTPIGKPQIAVMTISGNDVNFSGIVNDCVFRYWPKMTCDERLADSRRILETPEFKQELRLTYAKVIAAGRQAGGADPPESFQLYGGGYVGLFNFIDGDCDKVYWNVDRGWFSHTQYLTTTLRKQFSDLLNDLNAVIKSVGEELSPWGVTYVDGYDKGFDDHRFCEHREPKCIHERAHQDNDADTKIWSYQSPWDEGRHNPPLNDGEGKNRADICTKDAENEEQQSAAPDDTDIFENIADILVPNQDERQKMKDDKTLAPWNVSTGNWDQYPDVFAMMRDRMTLHDDPISIKWKYDWTYRMFHPKKSGYQFFASSWMEKIKANRPEPTAGGGGTPPPDPPKPTKALQIVLDHFVSEGDNSNYWSFFQLAPGESLDYCNTPNRIKLDQNHQIEGDVNNPPFPNGEWALDDRKLWDEEGCKYSSDGKGPGILRCPSMTADVKCEQDSKATKGEAETQSCVLNWRDDFHASVYCAW